MNIYSQYDDGLYCLCFLNDDICNTTHACMLMKDGTEFTLKVDQ